MANEKVKKEKAKTAKVSTKVGKLVDEISTLSVIDLAELVKALQDKLGVSAVPVAAPAAQAAAPAQGDTQAPAGSAKQTVVMTNAGSEKIAVIKALRQINQNLTLMDAKKITESVPAEILKDAKPEDAKEASEKLKAAGATVELK
ncbi:ribosomal protein L7/L12 [Patescibacteria group bacterium]|nr:ribosomal protein L7/L12 [Patescibacteria group bacterium]MBU2036499.1 ribosomal protein L7/L12 [Patescibacteria group bacterium]